MMYLRDRLLKMENDNILIEKCYENQIGPILKYNTIYP